MLHHGGFGEARGLVFWLIVAGNGQSGGPDKSCLRPFRVFRSSSVTVPGPDLRLRNLFICPRSGPGTSPGRSCTHSGREQQPGELTRGKALALLRRYTLLLGEGGWFGAGANREKGFLLPKGPALAFARFQLRAWKGERRAGAATMGLGAPYPPIRPTFINWVGRTTREAAGIPESRGNSRGCTGLWW